MIRNRMTLSFAALAFCALGAFSAASASAAEFHSSTAHTLLNGTQIGTDVFTVNAGTMTCNELFWTGTESSQTRTTTTVSPKYSECTAFGFFGQTIDVNGCAYVFHTAATGTVDLVCPSSPLTWTSPGCTVTIGSQSGLSVASFTTEGKSPKRDIKISMNISGITYTQHGEGLCSSGTFTNGTYKGEETMRGFDTLGAQVDLWYA